MTQDVKDAVTAHWNRRARDFDAGPTHGLLNPAQEAAWRGLLGRLAPAGPALDVLDRARAKAAARGLDARFLDADAEAPPFPPGSFDLIVERHVLWTLPDPARALRAWHALLRPGGRVALVEGAWWDMARRDEYAAVADRLPLFGGRPAAALDAPLRAAGFAAPTAVPLMEAAFWVEAPDVERYLLVATRE